MREHSLYLIFFLLVSYGSTGQSIINCGTASSYNIEFDYQAFLQSQQGFLLDPISVPIKIHIIRHNDGSGGASYAAIQNQLDIANQQFSNSNLNFYECSSAEYINDDALYVFDQLNDEGILQTSYNEEDILNIYYVFSISTPYGPAGGYSFFPWFANPQGHFVIIAQSNEIDNSTLAHELGHYFGVMHTHDDCGGNCPEYVNGSNCEVSGDKLCDTPADPNLYLFDCQNVSCQYTCSGLTDVNGDAYAPLLDNIMSYGPANCRETFTDQQNDLILYYYQSDRNYLSCTGCGPENDACLEAIPLTIESSCNPIPGTVDCANPDGFPVQPSCDGISIDPNGVFYTFIAPSNGEVTITVAPVAGNTIFDPVIVVYDGQPDCNILNEVFQGCIDENGTGESEILAISNLNSGELYWIRVYDYGNSEPYDGNFTICLVGLASACDVPSNLDEDDIGQDYADLDWNSVTDVDYYEVRYRLAGGVWNNVYPSSSSTTINGLICDSDYEWEARTHCDGGGISNWTSTQYFTTDDCTLPCDVPSNLDEDAIGEDYADLDWNSVSNNDYYEIRFMESGGSWNYITTSSSSTTINGLACNTDYEWEVRSYCDGGGVSNWSSTESFITDDCPLPCDYPSNLEEDVIGEDYADLDWSSVSNVDFYEIRYMESGGNWIYVTSTTSSTTINGLACNINYEWGVRTHCDGSGTSSWTSTESFTTDNCALPCDIPLNLEEDAIGQDYAVLDWSNVSNASHYEVRYRLLGGTWIYASPIPSSTTITGLSCNMDYEWEVRTYCNGSGVSDWTGSEIFTTEDCVPLCDVPANLHEGVIGTDYANLDWNNAANVDYYEVRYRISAGSWNYTTSTTSNILISGLACGLDYEWGARTHCNGGGISGWSSSQYFSTSDCGFPPGAPFLVYPINGQYDDGSNITFVWNPVSTATEYYFELSCLSNFDIVFDDSGNQGNNTSTSWSGFPKNGTIFFWRVKAGNAFGWGPWSDSFFINGNCSFINLPGPYLLAPEHNSSITNTLIDFKWSQTSCDNYYWFEIADDPSLINIDYKNEMLFDDHITLELTAPNGSYTYYWRVASHNNFGWSYYSNTSILTWILTAIDNTDNQGSLLIYPNPTDGLFQISFKNFKAGQYQAKVYSTTGQLVNSREIDINMVSHNEQFDLSMLSSGIYLIEIINEIGGKEIAKIMIE